MHGLSSILPCIVPVDRDMPANTAGSSYTL